MSNSNSLLSSLESMQNEVAVTLGDYQFTHKELRDLFDRVAPKDNWKNPVDAETDFTSVRERIGMHVAVQFFTGSAATLEVVKLAPSFSRYRVKAAGYYAAVGA